MPIHTFVHFNGNCREALGFYTQVFGLEMPKVVTYGEMPSESGSHLPDSTKDWIVFTQLEINGSTIMFSDTYPGMPLTQGNNVTLFYASGNEADIRETFTKLRVGGTVATELQETSWCKCYGGLTDRFGVVWHLSLTDEL